MVTCVLSKRERSGCANGSRQHYTQQQWRERSAKWLSVLSLAACSRYAKICNLFQRWINKLWNIVLEALNDQCEDLIGKTKYLQSSAGSAALGEARIASISAATAAKVSSGLLAYIWLFKCQFWFLIWLNSTCNDCLLLQLASKVEQAIWIAAGSKITADYRQRYRYTALALRTHPSLRTGLLQVLRCTVSFRVIFLL